MNKKVFITVMSALVLIMGLAACGRQSNEEQSVSQESAPAVSEELAIPLSKEEFEQMYSDPVRFKGRSVDFYAKVATDPSKESNAIYIQAYVDSKNSEKNTMIGYADSSLKVKEDDFIHVTGIVADEYVGENVYGEELTAPAIEADKIEKTDYATAVAPALKTIKVNKIVNQHGYVMTLQKVEFAEEETRFYLSIENKSKDTINFNFYHTKLIQGSKQFEPDDSYYGTDYPELQSDILPGVKTEGILRFERVDLSKGNLKMIAEGSSENYNLNFDPFKFIISTK